VAAQAAAAEVLRMRRAADRLEDSGRSSGGSGCDDDGERLFSDDCNPFLRPACGADLGCLIARLLDRSAVRSGRGPGGGGPKLGPLPYLTPVGSGSLLSAAASTASALPPAAATEPVKAGGFGFFSKGLSILKDAGKAVRQRLHFSWAWTGELLCSTP